MPTSVSNDVSTHASTLLRKIEPASGPLSDLKKSFGLFCRISICYVGPYGFEVDSDLMKRLALQCDEVSVVCWEVSDEEDRMLPPEF